MDLPRNGTSLRVHKRAVRRKDMAEHGKTHDTRHRWRKVISLPLYRSLLVGLLLLTTALPPAAEAGGLGKATARGTAKSIAKALRGDRLRDQATRVRPLPKDRTVFRYTTRERAQQELRQGIPAGRHLTARGTPGRPLSPTQAQRRYGLPQPPEARETVRLPKGQPVRPNKALGGAPGVGELTSPQRIPPAAVTTVVPLRPGK
jgi:hypothetical protein